MVGPSSFDSQPSKTSSKSGSGDSGQDDFDDRILSLQSLIDKRVSTALELLVTVSGLLQPNDYAHLGPILWYRHLDNVEPHVVAPVRTSHTPIELPLIVYADLFPRYAMR